MTARPASLVALVALVALALGAPACSRGAERELLVFAAASLREPFTSLAQDFRATHPGVAVTFNFAGTQALSAQLAHGAAADVVACADRRSMDELARAGLVTEPATFARNQLAVVVSPQAAGTVASFADLPSAARVVVGADDVPVGRATAQLLERADAALGPGFAARVRARVASRELNVKQVLAKVRMAEADAGVVYASDAVGIDDVVVLPIPAELAVLVDYPIAVAAAAPHPALARAFVELVRSPRGRAALARAGFLPAGGG